MNPLSLKEASDLFSKTKAVAMKAKGVSVVVCPPTIFITELGRKAKGNRVFLGAQDVFWEKGIGAFTGKLSSEMLASAQVSYVIVGHSELRSSGDTDEMVNKKLTAVLRAGLSAILCIGESQRDAEGVHLEFLKNQITQALAKIPRRYFLNLIIAYEPLWAIGADSVGAGTPTSVYELSIFIRKVLAEIAGRDIALSVSILYGGSVDEKNAPSFINDSGIQGLLVGRASLKADKFGAILKAAQS